jgi:hypothetical protein
MVHAPTRVAAGVVVGRCPVEMTLWRLFTGALSNPITPEKSKKVKQLQFSLTFLIVFL